MGWKKYVELCGISNSVKSPQRSNEVNQCSLSWMCLLSVEKNTVR